MTVHDRTWQYMTEQTWQIGEPALHLQRGAGLQLEVVSLGGEVGHVACTSVHTELEILRFCLVNFVVLIKDKWAVPLFTPSLLSLSRLLLHLDFFSMPLEVKYSFSVLYRNYNLLVRFCVLSIMNLMVWSTMKYITLAGLNWTKIGNHSFDHHVMWSSSKMLIEWLQEEFHDNKNFYKE